MGAARLHRLVAIVALWCPDAWMSCVVVLLFFVCLVSRPSVVLFSHNDILLSWYVVFVRGADWTTTLRKVCLVSSPTGALSCRHVICPLTAFSCYPVSLVCCCCCCWRDCMEHCAKSSMFGILSFWRFVFSPRDLSSNRVILLSCYRGMLWSSLSEGLNGQLR